MKIMQLARESMTPSQFATWAQELPIATLKAIAKENSWQAKTLIIHIIEHRDEPELLKLLFGLTGDNDHLVRFAALRAYYTHYAVKGDLLYIRGHRGVYEKLVEAQQLKVRQIKATEREGFNVL